MGRITPYLLSIRLPLILGFNLLLWAGSYAISLGLRFDFDPEEMSTADRLGLPLLILLTFRCASYMYWSLNQGYWRYASTDDLFRIIKAHLAASILFAASIWIGGIQSFPRSVIFIDAAFSILLCGGSRFLVRLVCERWLSAESRMRPHATAREVIVLGAGDSGHLVIKNLQSRRRLSYRPLMVLDDNSRLQGSTVSGVPVVGRLSDLSDLLDANSHVAAVIIAIPTLSRAKYDMIASTCKTFGVPAKRLQSFEDIALMDALDPSPALSIESVLERENTIEHESIVRESLRDKCVVVTGAGGSIGSELIRQILPFEPRRLVLIDNNEFHLYKIRGEVCEISPAVQKDFFIANVANEERLQNILGSIDPDVVFHAAAYKHVPLMEENVYEAFVNNVIGTRNLLRVSLRSGVRHFVLISTDKAVNSCSVMGHSKRLCELLVQSYAEELSSPVRAQGRMTAAIVRFGNVLNSNGSVVPLFKEQILSGGPITVTHPEMRRFFMSIREAVRLVLAAGTLGREGEIFLLDMGRPVKIVDVAKKMLALYGRRDIPIVFTGMRPGERLDEELTGEGEKMTPTSLSKVGQVISRFSYSLDIREWISRIEPRLELLEDREIARQMQDFLQRTRTQVSEVAASESVEQLVG